MGTDAVADFRARGEIVPRKPTAQANKGVQTAQNNAGNLYAGLEPQLESEATNPQGFGATNLANMNTASRQALGGSTAGITGQGELTAERTGNSAGVTGALDQAARTADQTQSENALNVQDQNAMLEQQQQQSALGALQGLYGTNVGSEAPLINAETAAGPGWEQTLFGNQGLLPGIAGLGK